MKKRQTEDPRLFDRQKSSVLESSDLSRKGNVDKDIRDLLEKMNSNKNYFSLSSCSGRIIILRQQTHSKVKLFNNMALVYYRGRVFFGVF
jgi:tRNA wybutosine-synthesizing protein 3